MAKKVIDVEISTTNKTESKEKVRDFFNSDESHMIFTPNAEMLVDASRDDYFQQVLNDASLNLCDSKGINFFNFHKFERITGTDFMLDICDLAEQQDKSVYLLGSGSEDVLKDLQQNIKNKYPDLNIIGSHPGPKIKLNKVGNINKLGLNTNKNEHILHEIVMKSPDVLFVAFGHIKQELWIHAYLEDIPGVDIAMGVGGAFDYHAGKVERAPTWVRNWGFEWLYRLYKEPSRLTRIIKAVVIFPVLNFLYQLKYLFNKITNEEKKSSSQGG
ncbi:MAG: WecB/TagA/CpsF family glycosyltransferase [Candidatus Paceibacteria bacterium]